MDRLLKKQKNVAQRKWKARMRIRGSAERPRLTVFVSGQHVSAQLIDDDAKHTIVSSATVGQGTKVNGTMTDKAVHVGTDIAKKAKKAKIKRVVFDRNGKLYHGRVKALAEAARAEGLEF